MNELSREKILAMEPGPELDALVDVIVMKQDRGELTKMTWFIPSGQSEWEYPAYSSDISAAWEVVEKMKSDNWNFVLSDDLYQDRWSATFYWDPNQTPIECVEKIAPEAICKAALLAVMGL